MKPEAPGQEPLQGYVLDWRRHSYRYWALVLVSSLDDDGRPTATQRWLSADRLIPVRSDPNDGGRVRSFG